MNFQDKLINPQNTIALIKEYEFSFKKRFGQNFLIDAHVLEKIISGAGIGKEDTVLEIGPGIGTLTQALCEAAGNVIAVEIDHDLIPILDRTLAAYDNVRVINEDILKLDLAALSKKPLKVVANLPYYITTPIIMGLFESGAPLKSITVMVQKEVADRMQAAPGGKDYGALSLAVQYYSSPEIIANVPPNCFIPRPNVGSAVINLIKHEVPPVTPEDPDFMFRIIKTAFSQRRKTLVNTLRSDRELGFSKEQLETVIKDMGLSETIRGERLSLAEFAGLSDRLLELKKV
ncbi:MAG: 16S rRNA (adenine(1518)-N(6)/adenine(1519)-N(6))-dimethyltransferase RsmA [Eubacteriales bacterium]|nr:16S rRNA (adenine(1518)-N(6)/adenine(1519)-N(6))-dimethyltransferase RsmA [Eubacteriales bacterium]